MVKFFIGVVGIGVLLWGGLPDAYGQKATEIFIPLGKSPGLSGTVTIIGKIETVNPRDRTITIVESSGTWSAKITDGTRIVLDRSKSRSTNQKGTFADLKEGWLVEVKYEDSEAKGKGPAEWVKVQRD